MSKYKNYTTLVPFKRTKNKQPKDWYFICTNRYSNSTKGELAEVFGKMYPKTEVVRIYSIKHIKKTLIRFKCTSDCPF